MHGSFGIFFFEFKWNFGVHTRPDKNVPSGVTHPSEGANAPGSDVPSVALGSSLRFFCPEKRVAPRITPTLTGKRERTHGAVVEKVLLVLACVDKNPRMINTRGRVMEGKGLKAFPLLVPLTSFRLQCLAFFKLRSPTQSTFDCSSRPTNWRR
jgi:hypothetical protein